MGGGSIGKKKNEKLFSRNEERVVARVSRVVDLGCSEIISHNNNCIIKLEEGGGRRKNRGSEHFVETSDSIGGTERASHVWLTEKAISGKKWNYLEQISRSCVLLQIKRFDESWRNVRKTL